ncbi:hypothetical protein [Streptomyces sp. NPDC047972]|uniref:hypothetical protein n=1 Tax=Streptomyces sp. NPDC047972 TaxID=3365493 RepID=UPI003712B9FD
MTLSHTTTAETVPALLATIQELHALQQPLTDALQRIHGDMENARSGGDEWASEWTVQVWNELPLAVRAAGGDQDAAQELAATIRDAARTAAARQTTEQDDTDCADCEHPKKLHNQRGCNGHWGPEEGCTCPLTHTGSTACKGATVCGDNDEPCDQHEREQAHAEGEHAFCGEECECTCASAGPEFVPAGHYRDCPQYTEPEAPEPPAVNPACTTCKPAPAVGQPAEAHDTDRAVCIEPARVRIINHPGVLATADTEIAALLDEYAAEVRDAALREAMNDLCAFGHGEAAAFLLRKAETVEDETR